MPRVVVASVNPVKIETARQAFTRMFADQTFEVSGVTVPSGVGNQPMTSEETRTGARNRAANARAAVPDADFWVGIEGGVYEDEIGLRAIGWMCVHSADGRRGEAHSSSFQLPPAVTALLRQGMEMGTADDIVFGRTNSKQANGAVGLLTGDVMTRTSYYVDAVILALIPFKSPEHFPHS